MSWEIKVWHEEVGERTRLSMETGPEVPEDVIASVVGSYWSQEVQFAEDEWDEGDFQPDVPGPTLQG